MFEFHRLVSSLEEQEEVAESCRRAELGCVEDKRRIADRLIAFLEPLQRRRSELLRDPEGLLELLEKGSARARERAEETLAEVRSAIGLDYRSRLVEMRS